MCKSIAANDCTCVRCKENFNEACLDREELKQTAGVASYGSANNANHSKIEDDSTNFALDISARDAAFTKIKTTNDNLPTQLRHQEDQILYLKAELYNLNLAAATRTDDVKTNNTGQQYARDNRQNHSGQRI